MMTNRQATVIDARDRRAVQGILPRTARGDQDGDAAAVAAIVPFPNAAKRDAESEKGNLPPKRVPNATLRSREYLTADEVEQLMSAAGSIGRHGHRDSTLILIAYRHGFRVSELVSLRWDQVDLKQGALHVGRLKNGTPSVHPIRGGRN